MKRVEVTWIDIISEDGWHSQARLDAFILTNVPVKQIGYLYKEEPHQLVLLDSYFEDLSLYGGVHTIPRGCIIDIKEI